MPVSRIFLLFLPWFEVAFSLCEVEFLVVILVDKVIASEATLNRVPNHLNHYFMKHDFEAQKDRTGAAWEIFQF